MPDRIRSKAVVQHGQKLVEEEVTLPELKDHEILIRVHHAALNPTDVLAFDLEAFGDGAILGCDFAGTVEALGPNASSFSVGDRVASFIWGGEISGLGAFSELCIADERDSFKVPSNISLAQAATIPLAAATAWLALFSSECLNLRKSKALSSSPVLILGGASTVGSFANNIAAAFDIATVSTCSKKNFEAVRQDGPKDVFDYNDSDVATQVVKQYPDLEYIFDTIGSPASSESIIKILGDRKGTLCTVRPGKAHTDGMGENIDVHDVFVFTIFPKEHDYRGKAQWPIHPENVELGREFFGLLPELISSNKLKPKAVQSLGALTPESVKQGMDLIRNKQVSSAKICFDVSDGSGTSTARI